MNKKRTFIIVSIAFVIVIATIFISYGFITADISGNETSKKTVFNGQMIKVEYSDGEETLSSNQSAFTPGSTITKTFTIKNTGNISVSYSINLDDITNTFVRKNDITYELYSNDTVLKNGMYDANGIFPDNKLTILNKDVLNRGKSKTYTLKINYLNSEENQIVDSGKSLSAKIVIEESKTSINKLMVYGNSQQNGIPSPETPIEVESVGDKTKNYLDIEHFGNINNWDTSRTYASYEISLPNGNYTFNIETDLKEFKKNILLLSKYKASSAEPTATIVSGYGTVVEKQGKFTISNNEKIYFNWYTGTKNQTNLTKLIDNVLNNFIIEEGTTATDYEPYGYKIPVKVRGKNFLDFDNLKLINTSETAVRGGWEFKFNKDIDITITHNSPEELPVGILLAKKVTDGVYGSNIQLTTNAKTISLKANEKLLVYVGSYTINGSYNMLSTYNITQIQLEEGTVSTSFEPYKEPTTTNIYLNEPLRKIGDYADYIDFESGKIYRNIHSKVLDGTEEWKNNTNYYNETSNTFYLSRNVLTPKTKFGVNLVISNSFKNTGEFIWGNTFTKDGICGYSSDLHYDAFIRINNQLIGSTQNVSADNVALFKTWLSSNKPTVYYVLNEEKSEDITLSNILLNKGTNIIEVDTNILPSNIEVEFDD